MSRARKVAYQIDVGVEPEGMAVSPDGTWAVNTSETTNMVHWIDTDKRVLVDNTLVDSRPRHAEFDKTGKKLWVSAEIGGTVSVIDTATHKVEHTIQFNIKGISKDKIQPVGVRLSDDGRYAFVALGPANHVAVVNAADLRGREVPAGRPPGLASGIHAGPEAAVHLQRGQQ